MRVAFAGSIQSRSSRCTCKSCWITRAIHATNLIQLTQPLSQPLRQGSATSREKVFVGVASGPNGDAGKIVREFDPKSEQVLFIPQLQGG